MAKPNARSPEANLPTTSMAWCISVPFWNQHLNGILHTSMLGEGGYSCAAMAKEWLPKLKRQPKGDQKKRGKNKPKADRDQTNVQKVDWLARVANDADESDGRSYQGAVDQAHSSSPSLIFHPKQGAIGRLHRGWQWMAICKIQRPELKGAADGKRCVFVCVCVCVSKVEDPRNGWFPYVQT